MASVSTDGGSPTPAADDSLGSSDSVESQPSSHTPPLASPSDTPPEKSGHTPLSSTLSNTSTGGGASRAGSAGSRETNLTGAVPSDEAPAEESVPVARKAEAVYPCEAEHDSELSFQIGAIFTGVTPSREPGWLEGELQGKKGLIPENYVKFL